MKVEPLDITDIWILRSGLVMSLGLDIQLSLTGPYFYCRHLSRISLNYDGVTKGFHPTFITFLVSVIVV